jgi:hypothetical protein
MVLAQQQQQQHRAIRKGKSISNDDACQAMSSFNEKKYMKLHINE